MTLGNFNSTNAKKTGQAAMFAGGNDSISPGFKYDIKTTFLSTTRKLPTFTLGAKRELKGKSALMNQTCTPVNVGPDSYTPQFKTVSHIKSVPKIGFGNSGRFPSLGAIRRPHETFYQYSSIGDQVASAKLTEYRYSHGKADRGANVTGVVSAKMLKIPLPHAAY